MKLAIFVSALSLGLFALNVALNVAHADDGKTKKTSIGTDSNGNIKLEGAGGDLDINIGDAASQVDADVTTTTKSSIKIEGNGKKATLACDPNKEIIIEGNQHTITLTGDCKKVHVSGNGHTVTMVNVGALLVEGTNHHVSYKAGIGGKAPKIKTEGLNNAVKKIEK